jgi:hypothetical protein
MIKLYVGVLRKKWRWLLVAHETAGWPTYQVCWKGTADDLEELARALLTDYLDDGARAQMVCVGFARLLGTRLRTGFWTLRESEVAEAVATLE